MRDLPVRRLASAALCASVLVGITGPAALAADPSRGHDRAASRAPVQAVQKEKLLARARALGAARPELAPVVDLLSRSLEKGSLPAAEAGRLGEAAKQAVLKAATDPKPAAPTAPAQATPTASSAPAASAKPAAAAKPTAPASSATTAKPGAPSAPATATASAKPATATVPSSPTASATPTAPASPTASAESARPTAAASASAPAASAAPAALTARAAERHVNFVNPPSSRDLTDDALAELETAIDNLVKAVTGQLDQLLSSATDVVTSLTDLVGPALLDEDTAAPSIESLPSLPSLPAEPSPSATG
ncbi:hypothetical protein [Streptomyces sp. NPDC001356]